MFLFQAPSISKLDSWVNNLFLKVLSAALQPLLTEENLEPPERVDMNIRDTPRRSSHTHGVKFLLKNNMSTTVGVFAGLMLGWEVTLW